MSKQPKAAPAPVPHPDLIKNLISNKIVVYARKDGNDVLLMCNYKEHVKNRPNQGMDIWGRAAKVVDNISNAVFKFYPKAEVTSQTGEAIVYKLNA
jgi:hypothetical protein